MLGELFQFSVQFLYCRSMAYAFVVSHLLFDLIGNLKSTDDITATDTLQLALELSAAFVSLLKYAKDSHTLDHVYTRVLHNRGMVVCAGHSR